MNVSRTSLSVAVTCSALLAFVLISSRPASADDARYTFDGFSIGTPFSKVMSHTPYDTPCDNDPIDNRARRFMVYGALPCRDRAFPQHTTVAIYIAHRDEDEYGAPIEAIAYLGGHYFDSRSNFPVKIGSLLAGGEGIDIYAEKLGKITARFDIERKKTKLHVTRFGADVFLIDNGSYVVGVVVGSMPEDPNNEQWRGLMQMWQRYTKEVR